MIDLYHVLIKFTFIYTIYVYLVDICIDLSSIHDVFDIGENKLRKYYLG